MLAWIAAGLAGLLVLFTLALIASGQQGALRGALDSKLRELALEVPPVAYGTTRVLVVTEPFVVTVDVCDPDLEYIQSYGYSSELLSLEAWVLGRTVPEALAYFLEVAESDVRFEVPIPDAIVDVRVLAYGGLAPAVDLGDNRTPMMRAAADALAQAYGLSYTTGTEVEDVQVLRPGPGFELRLSRHEGGGHRRTSRGDGLFGMSNLPLRVLRDECRRRLSVRAVELPDLQGSFDVHLTWDEQDPRGFERALADTLDLVVVQEPRELLKVTVVAAADAVVEPAPGADG